MVRFFLFFCLIGFLLSCKKDKNIAPSECVKGVFELVKSNLKCDSPGAMEVNLYQGIYKSQVIFFVDIICSHCNIAPPKSGYNCQKEQVEINNFLEVMDIIKVYDSCTGKFL